MNKIKEVTDLIKNNKRTVILTGAGVSTLSGIPDFRGENGVYSHSVSGEEILSEEYFLNNTEEFFNFYFNNLILKNAKPNKTHKIMNELYNKGFIQAIITQNIDNLHIKQDNLIEVHGNIDKNYCMGCYSEYNLKELLLLRDEEGIPRCSKCNLIIKPDITLYGENLNKEGLMDAIYQIKECDVLVIAGTSLSAYPICDIIEWFQGEAIIIINKTNTEKDKIADILIQDDLNEVFNEIYIELNGEAFQENNSKRLSKFLSLILRHHPEKIGIEVDKHGYADVDKLIDGINKSGLKIDFERLKEIVDYDNKQRYSFNKDMSKIRANQGHSINVIIPLRESIPPVALYHGTASKFYDNIKEKGLLKMNRQHVHLSENIKTAINIGKRHGSPIVLKIDTAKMHKDGYKFYLSKNNVWLTDEIPSQYITLIKRKEKNRCYMCSHWQHINIEEQFGLCELTNLKSKFNDGCPHGNKNNKSKKTGI